MDIVASRHRQVKVDHQVHCGDVQATGSHIGCQQDWHCPRLETVQGCSRRESKALSQQPTGCLSQWSREQHTAHFGRSVQGCGSRFTWLDKERAPLGASRAAQQLTLKQTRATAAMCTRSGSSLWTARPAEQAADSNVRRLELQHNLCGRAESPSLTDTLAFMQTGSSKPHLQSVAAGSAWSAGQWLRSPAPPAALPRGCRPCTCPRRSCTSELCELPAAGSRGGVVCWCAGRRTVLQVPTRSCTIVYSLPLAAGHSMASVGRAGCKPCRQTYKGGLLTSTCCALAAAAQKHGSHDKLHYEGVQQATCLGASFLEEILRPHSRSLCLCTRGLTCSGLRVLPSQPLGGAVCEKELTQAADHRCWPHAVLAPASSAEGFKPGLPLLLPSLHWPAPTRADLLRAQKVGQIDLFSLGRDKQVLLLQTLGCLQSLVSREVEGIAQGSLLKCHLQKQNRKQKSGSASVCQEHSCPPADTTASCLQAMAGHDRPWQAGM